MADLKELEKLWRFHGDTDAMWAVLADPEKKGNRWDSDEFFATGVTQIENLLSEARALGVPGKFARALDFGCGLGRLTQALAERFSTVFGVDIASTMIARAQHYNRHGNRCTYLQNTSNNLQLFESASFDFVVSMIVLQHMEHRYSRNYIREFVRVLAPGGLLVFQVPSHLVLPKPRRFIDPIHAKMPQPFLNSYRFAKKVLLGIQPPEWEMRGMPRPEVEALITQSGGTLFRCIPSNAAGVEWVDFWYFVGKTKESSSKD